MGAVAVALTKRTRRDERGVTVRGRSQQGVESDAVTRQSANDCTVSPFSWLHFLLEGKLPLIVSVSLALKQTMMFSFNAKKGC